MAGRVRIQHPQGELVHLCCAGFQPPGRHHFDGRQLIETRHNAMTAQIIPFIPQDAITLSHNQVRTSSLKVAEAFGKLHKNVIRKLETIECSPEFNQLNFEPVEYLDKKGEKRTLWEMTKDGFMFLVMGFTGKKAAQIKEAYIKAFNEMAEQLRLPAPNLKTKTALPNGLTLDQCDAIKALVKARAESCPKEKQGAAAIKCWSSIKSKFGCSYKEIAPEHFVEVLSLVARIELEGEYIPRDELPPIDPAAILGETFASSGVKPIAPSADAFINQKAMGLAYESVQYFRQHLILRASEFQCGKSGAVELTPDLEKRIGTVTLGTALACKQHEELQWVANQAAVMRHMATQLEEKIRGGKPQLSAP
jgi:Rha family phage regulatory protein